MSVRWSELTTAIGFKKQAAFGTATPATGLFRLSQLNANLIDPKLNKETDAAEFGKGHEFAVTEYPSHWDCEGSMEKNLTSELAAWLLAFALGKVTESPAGTYTCTPMDPVADGIEPPVFSVLQNIRGKYGDSGNVLARAIIALAIQNWEIAITTGPGRGSARATWSVIGSGKFDDASTIVMPSVTADHPLLGSSLAFSTNIGGAVDYVSTKKIVSVNFGGANGIDGAAGFYPGSGFQTAGDSTTGAIRGRHEAAARSFFLRWVARYDSTSLELAKLKAGTTGTAVITLTASATDTFTVTFQKIPISATVLGESNGIATVSCESTPLYHSGNGIVSAVAKSTLASICAADA